MNITQLPTPCYLVDEAILEHNLNILKEIMDQTGCRILLAQKAFSTFCLYPMIGNYLSGTAASGLFEARLGKEEMKKENHVYSPAYIEEDFDEIVTICDHIVFNSFSQLQKYKAKALKAGKQIGLRINPEYSTQEHAIYDPCAPYSRMGITIENFYADQLEGVSGLHIHTLCEQNADALIATINAVEEKFGTYLKQMQWLNLGGGHHITRDDYDKKALISCINRLQEKYRVQIYLEPGEAIALNAGFLITKVLDLIRNGMSIAILDTSAACHMPDVLEMPYRPAIIGAGLPQEKPYLYRLGGSICLAGDVIGDYSFDKPLQVGDHLTFCDMAIYTMVKNNTFNGINLPTIAVRDKQGDCRIICRFGYTDFKERLS